MLLAGSAAVKAQALFLQGIDHFNFPGQILADGFPDGIKAHDQAAVADIVHFPAKGFMIGHPGGAMAAAQGLQLFRNQIAFVHEGG